MKIKTTILSAHLLLTTFAAQAQQTGSFNTQVSFNGQNRGISCYVPNSYDSTQEYRLMIALHGMGDNSSNYRNALINSLDWENVFPNTIFICPDGGPDQFKDFYAPAGDEAIIDTSIAFAMENYSIDSSYVVLQGFSLGGRSAAKYGLDHPTTFKGLILNTPAFQGTADIRNDSLASLVYNYLNAAQIPMYIVIGDQDVLYYHLLENQVIPKLKKHDAIVSYRPVAGMPHTVPGMSIMSPAYPFFENPDSLDLDLDLFDTELPQRTCEANITPSCFVQNRGNTVITSLNIDYQFAGNSGTHTWTGNLDAYEHAEITLPTLSAAAGEQSLELSIGSVNGSQSDTLTDNNFLNDTVQVALAGDTLELSEDFEGKSEGWIFTETKTLFEWYRDTDVKKSGNASIANFNTILLFYTTGNVESFESPLLDLSTAQTSHLSFDVAYNYHKYTPPYFLADTAFADTLEIVVSTDCGQSWQSLYKKGGEDLTTADDPMLNPFSLQECFFDPAPSEWRRDSIDLGAYVGEPEAIVKFNYISANGGSIYIDDILIDGEMISLREISKQNIELYPNPAKDHVNISLKGERITAVQIFDISGNRVLARDISDGNTENLRVETNSLAPGVYQVQVTAEGKNHTKKFLIHP